MYKVIGTNQGSKEIYVKDIRFETQLVVGYSETWNQFGEILVLKQDEHGLFSWNHVGGSPCIDELKFYEAFNLNEITNIKVIDPYHLRQ